VTLAKAEEAKPKQIIVSDNFEEKDLNGRADAGQPASAIFIGCSLGH